MESGAFSLTVTVLVPLRLTVFPASSVMLPSKRKLITPVLLALHVVEKVLVVFLASPVASAHLFEQPSVFPELKIFICQLAVPLTVIEAVTLLPFVIVPLETLKL